METPGLLKSIFFAQRSVLSTQRSQGAFEYVLLLAGIILIAVLAILILRGSVLPTINNQVSNNTHAWDNVTNVNCTVVSGTPVCNYTG